MSLKSIKTVFLVGSIYDLALGLVFGLFYKAIYAYFQAPLPDIAGYVQLPAFCIFIFGVGFYMVSQDPVAHKGIVLLGILMKINFIIVAGGNYLFGQLPAFYLPWVILDVVFLALFIAANSSLSRQTAAPQRV